jgi:hypothetical protein
LDRARALQRALAEGIVMPKRTDDENDFGEFLAWLPKPIDELTEEERDEYFREWATRRLRARQSVLRKARRDAYERDRERRARAHRLITLGAEVEASGLADVINHDPDGVYGAGAIFAQNASQKPELVRQALTLGRARDVVRSSPAWRKRGERQKITGRYRIVFYTRPPVHVREAMRKAGFKWRVGLRAWVGDTMWDKLRWFLAEYGGRVDQYAPDTE